MEKKKRKVLIVDCGMIVLEVLYSRLQQYERVAATF
jgi:hypothetical protein